MTNSNSSLGATTREIFKWNESRSFVALVLCIGVLGGCASVPRQQPQFPPHLAQFANHPFFLEGCDTGYGSAGATNIYIDLGKKRQSNAIAFIAASAAQAQQRCQWLHADLQRQLAYVDHKFRENNRCVRRLYDVNGRREVDTRECVFVAEGWEARR